MPFFDNDTLLNWEWPANRIIKHKMVIKIIDIAAVKKIIKSPSLAANIPDPMALRGKVLSSDLNDEMEIIKLVLPKVELGDISMKAKLALGMIDDKTVVCITTLPSNLNDIIEEKDWIEKWKCN